MDRIQGSLDCTFLEPSLSAFLKPSPFSSLRLPQVSTFRKPLPSPTSHLPQAFTPPQSFTFLKPSPSPSLITAIVDMSCIVIGKPFVAVTTGRISDLKEITRLKTLVCLVQELQLRHLVFPLQSVLRSRAACTSSSSRLDCLVQTALVHTVLVDTLLVHTVLVHTALLHTVLLRTVSQCSGCSVVSVQGAGVHQP